MTTRDQQRAQREADEALIARRERIATAVLAALIANPEHADKGLTNAEFASDAIRLADTLIQALDAPGAK